MGWFLEEIMLTPIYTQIWMSAQISKKIIQDYYLTKAESMDEVKLSLAHFKETGKAYCSAPSFLSFYQYTTHFINESSLTPFITLTAVLSYILVAEVLPIPFPISLQGLAVSL